MTTISVCDDGINVNNPFPVDDFDSWHNFDNDFNPDLNFFNYISRSNYFLPSEIKPIITHSNNNFSLLHLNVRSLMHKTTDINMLLHDSGVDFNVLAITETWLNDVSAPSVQIPNYQFSYKNRSSKLGGGVGFFIRQDLTYITRNDLSLMSECIEVLAVELFCKSINIIVFVVYRPPNTDANNFIDLLSNLVNKAKKSNRLVYVAGDFNIDLLNDDHKCIKVDFLNSFYSENFIPVITNPTRITD